MIMSSSVLSFAGKNFKWNTKDDAKNVVDDINSAPSMKCLVLEGNTLGTEAAKAIGDAIANHPEFERAHWRDLFTGRLKTEIPEALKHLFSGLIRAKAKLIELDLSDNALGPVGVEGMTEFIKSPVCYSLQELRLNNNGLGIKGGTMLAESLMTLVSNARNAGTPLRLKVFIAGRNRLEKDGAKVYAEFFSTVGTLEEIAMPQNGIFHEGIAALAKAISCNPNLKIINLNDNTFTPKGAAAMAQHLSSASNLEIINFGDCLLKTAGAISISSAIKNSHPKLKELHLDSNEIRVAGGLSVVDAIANKSNLQHLMIDANQFGDDGCKEISQKLRHCGKIGALQTLDDDEEPDEEEEEEEGEGDDTLEEDDASGAEEEEITAGEFSGVSPLKRRESVIEIIKCTGEEFAYQPSAPRLLGLGNMAPRLLVEEAKRRSIARESGDIGAIEEGLYLDAAFIHECLGLFMKTASLSGISNKQVCDLVTRCTTELLKEAFDYAKRKDLISAATNSLLVHFGLLKSEDKSFKIEWDLRGCVLHLSDLAFLLPKETTSSLQFFFSRPDKRLEEFSSEKHKLMSALYKM